ncbi:hypothetical protein EOA60_09555 [Mesorhizobium sp. M1A.F.Ca.IN.020.06.1.1]|uniref:hypothetical protein n=1 Tax=unclassified Mesorhizobium TaxID=325217 RepID=UPI000FCA2B0F|nr:MULTISPECIES: hypothetical protein [unclassified Mesorhizobium]RUV84315.1 hypothetical protein EOA51_22090 [Mesorhizobium sp. M1A.F.Ca.IN.020.32.1.1]RUW13852.1 hypothetical protein EOA46_05150 [Mesorhizobium sp. M1A.F.Ca.IN.022.05.2.1]RUW32375.1 hypothetical protein EOA60_09555 [Mesorhizobium sp. M1A.F.Ca.IN.020.06.1.1]RWF81315.1 MAG: hypothetical protein EOQ35_14235 [Mesorhizobium sp.]RWG06191.1 MAG: hypothetical protein EOQ38_02125 [Mesorhizobium sp.]
MTDRPHPTVVHRYAIPLDVALEQLIGREATDAEGWNASVQGDDLVIEVVAPAYVGRTVEVPDDFDVEKLCDAILAGEFKLSPAEPRPPPSGETQKINTPEKPKGGPLAQRAGIMCGERGFWTFITKRFGVAIASADEAAVWLKARCGVESRVEFDHIEAKAANFREIDKLYRLWLEGFD